MRIVPRLVYPALGTVRKISGGIGRGPDTFVLLEIPTVSGPRDSIRATSIDAMSGQFDFRSARQKLGRDRLESQLLRERIETERIMYINLYQYQSDKFLPFCLLLNHNLYLIIYLHIYVFSLLPNSL